MGLRNSGKRTLLKQLELLYGNGFTQEERMSIKKDIIKLTVASMQRLISAAREKGGIRELSKPENDVRIRNTERSLDF